MTDILSTAAKKRHAAAAERLALAACQLSAAQKRLSLAENPQAPAACLRGLAGTLLSAAGALLSATERPHSAEAGLAALTEKFAAHLLALHAGKQVRLCASHPWSWSPPQTAAATLSALPRPVRS